MAKSHAYLLSLLLLLGAACETEPPVGPAPSAEAGDTIRAAGAHAYRADLYPTTYFQGRLELRRAGGSADSLGGTLEANYINPYIESSPLTGTLTNWRVDGDRVEFTTTFFYHGGSFRGPYRLRHRGFMAGDTLVGAFLLESASISGSDTAWSGRHSGPFEARPQRLVVPPEKVVELVEGGDQQARVYERLPRPLVIRVRDAEGRPQRGVRVRWSMWQSDARVEPRVSTTDSAGMARTTARLGQKAGRQWGFAAVLGSRPVLVEATATPADVAALEPTPHLDAVVVADTVRIEHGARDRFGNAVAGADVVWSTSNPAVAKIGSDGLLQGLAAGEVVVSVRADDVRGELHMRVLEPPAPARRWIAAGRWHTCAVRSDGAAFCWGGNAGGQLGTGTLGGSSSVPVPVTGGHRFVSITAGAAHTCALDQQRQAYCWGGNPAGALVGGRAGDFYPTPTPVGSGIAFVALAAAQDHTCGVTTRLTAVCWGWNGHGETGWGWTRPIEAGISTYPPAPVVSRNAFVDIRAADARTCGLGVYGAGFCWGKPPRGDGDLAGNATLPVPVFPSDSLVAISPGVPGCAIDAAHRLLCWGRNPAGDDPSRIEALPVPIAPGISALTLQTSVTRPWVQEQGHACVLLATDRTAACWGANDQGQLGSGVSDAFAAPAPVAGAHRFTDLTTGLQHTCGIDVDGRAWCWGTNADGQLGTDDLTSSRVPRAVTGGHRFGFP